MKGRSVTRTTPVQSGTPGALLSRAARNRVLFPLLAYRSCCSVQCPFVSSLDRCHCCCCCCCCCSDEATNRYTTRWFDPKGPPIPLIESLINVKNNRVQLQRRREAATSSARRGRQSQVPTPSIGCRRVRNENRKFCPLCMRIMGMRARTRAT